MPMRRWIFWILYSPRSSVGEPKSRVVLPACFHLGWLSLLALAAYPVLAADKINAKLSVPDALTVPDRAVQLEGRLTRDNLLTRTGVGGELIEFLVGGKKVGTSMTGGDGRGFFQYTPRMRGNLTLTVRLADSPRVATAEGTATLFSWERRRPILLVEVVALIEDAGAPLVPLSSLAGDKTLPLSPTPTPDAAAELKRLSEFYFNVLYIARSQSEAADSDATRHWLREHRFPPGPIIFVPDKEEALKSKIDELRAQGWDNLKAGIGRSKAFAEVLVAERLDVVIVPATERGVLPKKAQLASTWKEVRKKRL
jgi:hypothetical protein